MPTTGRGREAETAAADTAATAKGTSTSAGADVVVAVVDAGALRLCGAEDPSCDLLRPLLRELDLVWRWRHAIV